MTNLDIQKAYLGLDEVDKVYLGSEQVYPTGGETDYSREPLTINALDQVSLTVNSRYSGGTVYYRVKGDTTWQSLTSGQTLTIQPQAPVQLMGYSGATGLFSGGTQSGHYEVYGNVMSLVHGENFIGQTVIPSSLVDCFYATFRNCQSLVSIKNLVMPATTLSDGCYRSMFNKCWYLEELPDVFLPANAQLSSACCRYTFEELGNNLGQSIEVPSGFLPTTNLAVACYEAMFSRANISKAPELPATIMQTKCYMQMFQYCTGLTASSFLPEVVFPQTPYPNSFSSMFNMCNRLSTVTCLATSGIGDASNTNLWLTGVAANGTFYKHPNATWPSGNNGIPSGWTVQDYVAPNP